MADSSPWKKFRSRKFLFALLGSVISVSAKFIGVPQIAVNWALGILGTYILAEGAADVVRANGSNGK